MIFDAILALLTGVLTGVLGLFPNYNPDFGGFGSGMGGALAAASNLFPVVTLGVCIVALVACRVFITGVAFVAWVWDKVPFTFK